MKLTFVDAAVLIAAARGGSEQAARAMEILDDPEREFAASPFLRLDVLPQAAFNNYRPPFILTIVVRLGRSSEFYAGARGPYRKFRITGGVPALPVAGMVEVGKRARW